MKIRNPSPRVWPRKYIEIPAKIQKWLFLGHFGVFFRIFSTFFGIQFFFVVCTRPAWVAILIVLRIQFAIIYAPKVHFQFSELEM